MKETSNKLNNLNLLSKTQHAEEVGQGQYRLYTGQEVKHGGMSKPGMAICAGCGAICAHKRWYLKLDEARTAEKNENIRRILCPGCKRVQDKMYQGEVVLEGDLSHDRDAILALIRHVEGKCWHDNPRSRIASIDEDKDRMVLLTTTKWLAVRIGKELEKSHKGRLEIKPVPDEQYVRVHWSH